ncbi:MAG: Biotin-requiring enzyme, partial [Acidobacteria bacterium]|nr:Biotin-requiring enzyme [Acidobacteriota bacterium]
LEAMKMQNNLPSPRDGRVAALALKPGDSVGRGQVLLTLE